MWRSENTVRRITAIIAAKFPTFGAGQKSEFNPLVNALSDKPPAFALMVDVRDVVDAVLSEVSQDEVQSARRDKK